MYLTSESEFDLEDPLEALDDAFEALEDALEVAALSMPSSLEPSDSYKPLLFKADCFKIL